MQPISNPWSIILVQFKNSTATQEDINLVLSKMHDLFIDTNPSNFNIVKYFKDMSHGLIDMSGSEIIGPLRLNGNKNDYNKGNFEGTAASEVLTESIRIAVGKGRILKEKVVVCLLENGDIYGIGSNIFIGAGTLIPPEICHEIGHSYGLDHSRIEINAIQDDYMDPMDIMSVRATLSATHPKYLYVGPGLNAANMKFLNWLDDNRVFKINDRHSGQIQLRPLHSRQLSGYLAAECCNYLIEYRASKDWDSEFRSCILIHKMEQNHSYLITTQKFNDDELDKLKNDPYKRAQVSQLTAGNKFTVKCSNLLSFEITVLDIDNFNQIANLYIKSINLTPGPIPPTDPGDMYGGIGVDGGGLLIRKGKIIRIPPRSPVMRIFKMLHALTFAFIKIALKLTKSLNYNQK